MTRLGTRVGEVCDSIRIFDQCVICSPLRATGVWRWRKLAPVAKQKIGTPVDFTGRKDGERNHVNDAASSCVERGLGVECEKSLEACVL